VVFVGALSYALVAQAATIYCAHGSGACEGTDSGDTIYGSNGDDDIRAHQGGDTVYGDQGSDLVNGGEQGDALWGDAGPDPQQGDDGWEFFNCSGEWCGVNGGEGADGGSGNAGRDWDGSVDGESGGQGMDWLDGRNGGVDNADGGADSDECYVDHADIVTSCDIHYSQPPPP
jgi:hypothetical protein